MSSTPQMHSSEVCLQVDDLLDGYALDCLEADERALVDRHLATCLQQQDRLAELQEVMTAIGRTAPALAPPPAIWDRLLAETGAVGADVTSAPSAPTPLRSAVGRGSTVVTLHRWVAWAGAAAAGLLLASTVALGVALQGEDDGAEPTVDPVVAMVARGGQVQPLNTQPQPQALTRVGQGSIIVAPAMAPAVVVDHWTPSTDTLQYIVWMAAASGGQPTVLGEIHIDEDGHGVLVLNGVTSFDGYGIFGISIKTAGATGLQDVLLGEPPTQAS